MERIEIALLRLILIGCVGIEMLASVAQAERAAMQFAEVYVVGIGGGKIRGAVCEEIEKSVLLVRGGHIVVTGAEEQTFCYLGFCAYLERMHAFQTFVGLGVECIVARAVVPAAVIVVRVVAHVRGAVICVLVFEVEGKYILNRRGCAEVDAPRRTQFVVNGYYVLLVLSISRSRPVGIPRRCHHEIIALREIVERRRAYRKADAEGIVLDGAHDKA